MSHDTTAELLAARVCEGEHVRFYGAVRPDGSTQLSGVAYFATRITEENKWGAMRTFGFRHTPEPGSVIFTDGVGFHGPYLPDTIVRWNHLVCCTASTTLSTIPGAPTVACQKACGHDGVHESTLDFIGECEVMWTDTTVPAVTVKDEQI